MLQRLPIALAQTKAGNTSENVLKMKSDKLYILFIEKKKILKKYTKYNQFNKVLKQNSYSIYEF